MRFRAALAVFRNRFYLSVAAVVAAHIPACLGWRSRVGGKHGVAGGLPDIGETKVGTKPDWGQRMSQMSSVVAAGSPPICALVNLLPRWRDDGKSPGATPLVSRHHLFAVGVGDGGSSVCAWVYVYDYDLRRELLTPTLWVLAWTMFLRMRMCW